MKLGRWCCVPVCRGVGVLGWRRRDLSAGQAIRRSFMFYISLGLVLASTWVIQRVYTEKSNV